MKRLKVLVPMTLLLALSSSGALRSIALADVPQFGMTPEAAQEALEEGERVEAQIADSTAAERLPHHDLERDQALQLISSVFGTQLESVAGIFGDLKVGRFLSDNAAVVEAGDQAPARGVVIGDGHYDGPALLESTIPLRTEDSSGEEGPVDLALERTDGDLRSTTPLVDLGIPGRLGEGIDLPESEVQIELKGAPDERVPSIVDRTVAVYPEVAEDTSFAVAPSPTGVETFTLLQAPTAPHSQTYKLSLPYGATLSPSADGGAEVAEGDRSSLRVFPPMAMDAEGNEVPVSLEVSGDSFTVRAAPQEGVAYPILVDPVIESHNWYGYQNPDGLHAWQGSSNNQGLLYNEHSALGYPGTDLRAVNGFTLAYNAEAQWAYSVPRYASDIEDFGSAPTSYVSAMTLTDLFFVTNQDKSLYPMMATGIWSPTAKNWLIAWGHGGNTGNIEDLGTTYTFTNSSQAGKQAVDNVLWAGETHTMTSDRETYVGSTAVQLADSGAPTGTVTESKTWYDKAPVPSLEFSAEDTGLGIQSFSLADQASPPHSWSTAVGCTGTVSSPCPRRWSRAQGERLTFDPSDLPDGIDPISVTVKDPVGNSATANTHIKIDHTAPSLNLAGSVTEQSVVGTSRPRYVLQANAADGTPSAPQSGVASLTIKLDGTTVGSWSPGCNTQNCEMQKDWTLEAADYSLGDHSLEVTATDAVGRATTKVQTLSLTADEAAPAVSVTGSLKGSPTGWIESPGTYSATAVSSDGGAGVVELRLVLDGQTISSHTQACSYGACAFNANFPVDATSLSAGMHEAAVIAIDGAGNETRSGWSLGVNPAESTTGAEAAAVSDSLIAGSGSPTVPSAIGSVPYDPSLTEDSEVGEVEAEIPDLAVDGSGAEGDISLSPREGYSITGLSGLPFVMALRGEGAEAAVGEMIAGGDGVGYVNVDDGVDLVTRPTRNGITNYLILHTAEATRSLSWEILTVEPVELTARSDGGIDIYIDPAEAVPSTVGLTAGELSDEPQLVASIASPEVLDASGAVVPASLSIDGTVVTLTIEANSSTAFPASAEVGLHLVGPIGGWFPETNSPDLPSDAALGGLGVSDTGDEYPVGAKWEANTEGTAVSAFTADANAEITFAPAPGSEVGSLTIQPAIEEYAPQNANPPVTYGAGLVQCVATGPIRPYFYGLGLQTYGLASCSLTGERPPDFDGLSGGACLQKRVSLNGVAAWTEVRCNGSHTGAANWTTNWFATKNCDHGVFRGKSWVYLHYTSHLYPTESLTENRRCE